MSIAVNNNTANTYAAGNNNGAAAGNNQNAVQNTNPNTTEPKDVVEISGQTPENAKNTKKLYGKPVNPELVAKMKQEIENNYNQLKQLVEGLILNQGINWADVIRGKATLYADPATIKQAQADIAEDGYYGVEQTAGRIVDFAKALIGDDISKLPEIRAAVEKGFAAAKKALGLKKDENLPDVSMKTYDRIMAEFDSWEKAGAIPPAKQE